MATMQRSAKRTSRSRAAPAAARARPREFRFCLDRHGAQHFNFEQCLWIERSVAMAFTPVRTTALETLAINLLALAAPPGDARPARDCARARLLPMAREFCEQCLLGAPQAGWVLPRPVIRAWMHARQRSRSARR
jgi:hypothetical protein